jgi:glutamine amidotransferase
MRLTIVDVGAGNLHSVRKACAHLLGAEQVHVSSHPDAVAQAERILLPGVGAFGDCMAGLQAIDGLRGALEDAVLTRAAPFLGICVGMQMLFEEGHEHGHHKGLGWLQGQVTAMTHAQLPIPHMGWNKLCPTQPDHPLLRGIGAADHVYFVHSYHAQHVAQKNLLASVDYGGEIVAMVARDNIAGMQFHPEKSQSVGLRLLDNFMGWSPKDT